MASSRRSSRHHRRPWDYAIRPGLRGILTYRDPDISPPSQACQGLLSAGSDKPFHATVSQAAIVYEVRLLVGVR
jgi:hypothetical protein